jgi:hypothetical protein
MTNRRDDDAGDPMADMLDGLRAREPEPPAGFVAVVMRRIEAVQESLPFWRRLRRRQIAFRTTNLLERQRVNTASSSFGQRNTRETTGGEGSMMKKVLFTMAAIGAAAIVSSVWFGFPPVGRGTDATVGGAQRYQASAAPTVAPDANTSVQALLQTDTFDRLMKNKDTRALLHKAASDPALGRALAEPALARALADPSFEKALSEPALARAIADPSLARALADPALARALADPALARALADPALARAAADPAMARAVSDPAMARALADPALARALADPAMARALADPAMARALADPALARALADPALARALADPAMARALADPAMARALADPAMARALADPSFQKALADPAFEKAMRAE